MSAAAFLIAAALAVAFGRHFGVKLEKEAGHEGY